MAVSAIHSRPADSCWTVVAIVRFVVSSQRARKHAQAVTVAEHS
jgi:hypothetical protein